MKIPRKYLKLFLAAGIVLLVGGAFGYISAGKVPNFIYQRTSLQNGPWITNPNIGGSAADMYTKAVIARHGLLALDRSEAIYYSATIDSEGLLLRGEQDYVIEGVDLDADWWSITIYGADDFLIPNDENRYSFTNTEIEREEDGSWKIHLSRTAEEGNWLPTGKEESFSILLRLYKPGDEFYDDPGGVELPRIVKEEA